MPAITRSWNKLADDAEVQNLYVPGAIVAGTVTATAVVAGSISGAVSPLTPPFIYTAAGTENPAGFPVAFPTGARGGVAYVAQVGLAGVAAFELDDVPAASYADDHIVVKTSAVPAAGDKLSIIVLP